MLMLSEIRRWKAEAVNCFMNPTTPDGRNFVVKGVAVVLFESSTG
jgi:hypothetical protein